MKYESHGHLDQAGNGVGESDGIEKPSDVIKALLLTVAVLSDSIFSLSFFPGPSAPPPSSRYVYYPGDGDGRRRPHLRKQRQAGVHAGAGPAVLLRGSPDRWVHLRDLVPGPTPGGIALA